MKEKEVNFMKYTNRFNVKEVNFMKYTNKFNVPEPIVQAIKNDSYSKGDADISVTELISPPRIRRLQAKHADELVEDISENIFRLLGHLMHSLLEKSADNGIAERRLAIEVEGWKLSGQMDYFKDGVLTDYKLTNVAKESGEIPNEWVQQLNVYAEILRQNGIEVKGLEVCAIYRDFYQSQTNKEGYPKSQVGLFQIPLWPQSQAQAFIKERMILHKQSLITLPECTPEERWAKPDMWAVTQPNASRSFKNFTSHEEAITVAESKGKNWIVEPRPGGSIRCNLYCNVSAFCSQFNNETGNKI